MAHFTLGEAQPRLSRRISYFEYGH